MKVQTVTLIGLALLTGACSDRDPVGQEQVDTATAPAATTQVVEAEERGTAAFISHMHHHASQLGQLNAALEVGSLAAAQRPAYWLAGHDEISGIPEGWQVYINEMRDAAYTVDSARDITEARAAAKRIEDSCRGCHAAAGKEVTDLQVN